LTDASGNYSFTGLPAGGNYTITPSKTALAPGSSGINTTDVLAIQRHFLSVTLIPAGCRLTAADANTNGTINTQDVIAVQRFFLALTTGTASVGQYKFIPPTLSYTNLGTNQTNQNFAMYVVGDVASPFVNRAGQPEPDGLTGNDLGFSNVASVVLPELVMDRSNRNFTAPVTTSMVETTENIVGFQGDFTFDQRVVTFATEPVQKAGLTAGNWTVAGNVLPGQGPVRTLRVSAFSNDFVPLHGVGALFELKINSVGRRGDNTPLIWAAPPDNFIFINGDLNNQRPGSAPAGRVTSHF
jgi:hypothetical protein